MTLILDLSPDINVNTFESKRVIYIKLHFTADQISHDNYVDYRYVHQDTLSCDSKEMH